MTFLLVRHKVKDFDAWKRVFSSHIQAQKEAGLGVERILRNLDDPNDVVLLFEVFDIDKARGFVSGADVPQKGNHHRGTGHHQDRPQQDREGDGEIEDQPRGQARQHPGDGRPDRHQPPYRGPGIAQLTEPQGQPPLVEDEGDRERDEGQKHFAQQLVRIEKGPTENPPAHGPRQEAHQKKQQDRGDPQPPGQPLRTDPQHNHCGQGEEVVLGQRRSDEVTE